MLEEITKIIITLTTTPKRIFRIEPCLDALLNQKTSHRYEVHLNIPKELKSTGEKYTIPDFFKKYQTSDKLKIYLDLEDVGSITKIYYTIGRAKNPSDIIIVCDDDMIYNEYLVEEHVNNQMTYPNTAVGYDGINVLKDGSQFLYNDIRDTYVTSISRNRYCNVLQCFKTISYRRSFFQSDFYEFVKLGGWNDDVTLSAYMSYVGVKKLCTFYKKDRNIQSLEDWWEYGLGKNGHLTFPLVKDNTFKDQLDGCDIFRSKNQDDKYDSFKKLNLFLD
jgi:hypothetical protein